MREGWEKIEEGYKRGPVELLDNGGGYGPQRGNGRWALMFRGRWIANIDYLAEAKQRGEELISTETGGTR